MRSFAWPIEDVVSAHPELYLEHCAVMAVALMSRHATSPCEFVVECENLTLAELNGDSKFVLGVAWNEDTAVRAARVLRSEQPRPIVERAAVAVAALAFAHLIPNGQMRVTEQGQRADYWFPRLRRALEISGTASSREVARRHRQKVVQLMGNPRQWNGYVFVCCFAPAARSIRWSYHSQREGNHATP